MGILFDDQDSSSILGSVGSLGVTGAIGYYGWNEIQRRKGNYKKIVDSKSGKAIAKEAVKLESNSQALTGNLLKKKTLIVDLENFAKPKDVSSEIKGILDGIDVKFREKLSKITRDNMATGIKNQHINIEVVGGKVVNIHTRFLGRNVSLGEIQGRDGALVMPDGRKRYAPKFLTPGQTRDVTASGGGLAMADNAVDINMAKLHTIEELYGNARSADAAAIQARRAIKGFDAHYQENLIEGTQQYRTKINTVIPTFIKDGKYISGTAFDDEVKDFISQTSKEYKGLNSTLARKLKYNIHPWAVLKDEISGIGGYLNPKAHILGKNLTEQALLLGGNFWDSEVGGNPVRQLHNRNVRFANVTDKTRGLSGTNQFKVQGVYAGDEFRNLYNKLGATGVFGDVTTVLGKDGVLIEKALAGENLIEASSKNIPFAFKGSPIKVSHEMNLLIAQSMLDQKGATYMHRKFKNKTAQQLAEIMSKKGNEGTRDQIYKGFSEMLEDGPITFKKGINVANLTGRNGQKITLSTGTMGIHTVHSNNVIRGMRATEDGVRIIADANFTFGESGKFWGPFGKVEVAGYTKRQRIATAMYGLQNNLSHEVLADALRKGSGNDIYEGIEKIAGMFDKDLHMVLSSIDPNRKNVVLGGINKEISDLSSYDKDGKLIYSTVNTSVSPDTIQANHGVDTGVVSIGNTQIKRLRTAGYTEAADELMRFSEIDTQFASDVSKHILPVVANDMSGQSYGLRFDDLSVDEIGELMGGDIEKSRKLAMSIADRQSADHLLSKSASADAIFYIDLNQGTNNYNNIPIALFDSKYTGSTIQRETEGVEDILGIYNKTNRDLLSAIKSGKNPDIIDSLSSAVDKATAKLVQSAYKIDHVNPHGSSRVYTGPQGLDMERLTSLDVKYSGRVEKILQESYGLSIDDIDTKAVSGYNTAIIDEKLAFTDIYKKEIGEYKKTLGVDSLSVDQISEFNNANRNKLLKKGMYEAIGRNPFYGAESFTIAKVMDMENFANQLNDMVGPDKTDIEWITGNKNKVHLNAIAEVMAQADQDKDLIAAVTIADEKVRMTTGGKWKNYKSYVANFVSGKGGIKDDAFLTVEKNMAPGMQANVSQEAISSFYNVTMPYNKDINPYMADIFEDSTNLKAQEKAMLFEHYTTTLPERAIGAKSPISQQSFNEIHSIFDVTKNNEDEAVKLWNKHLTMKGGEGGKIDLMMEISENEVRKIHRASRKFNQDFAPVVDFMTKNVTTRDSAASFYHFAANMSKDAQMGDIGTKRLLENKASSGFAKSMAVGAGEFMMNITKKMRENKGLMAAGGAVLAGAFLLQSPDNNIKNQEAREESRIKNRRTYENGINPPTGIVSKAVGGARYALTGELPPGVSAGQVQGMVGGGGSQYVINQSNAINSRYVEDLQNENKQNNWNYGG